MSSRILQALPVNSKWINLAFQETIKRSPINIRPLFLVEQRRSYKGAALFAMANLNYYRLVTQIGGGDSIDGVDYRDEAIDLIEWLVDNRSTGYSGFCGGHKHEIQHLDGHGIPNDPDIVSTSFAVKALLSAASIDRGYADIARTAERFVMNELDYQEIDEGARINYHLNHPDNKEYYTLNANALGARMFIDLYEYFAENRFRARGRKILDYVASRQTDVGGWAYRDPSTTSHLSMDNHHNGFIIESFLHHRKVTDSSRYDEVLDRALAFYRDTLFDPDGAPNFDEEHAYPRDIHASAQGALVFTYAGDLPFAARILEWTLDHMYDLDQHRFYFRKQRWYTKRFTLMRWGQAWMAYALSEYLSTLHDGDGP